MLKRGRRIGLSVSRAIPERVSEHDHRARRRRVGGRRSGKGCQGRLWIILPFFRPSFLSSLELLQLPQNLEELRGLEISMITLAASLLSHSRSAIDDPRATIRIGD